MRHDSSTASSQTTPVTSRVSLWTRSLQLACLVGILSTSGFESLLAAPRKAPALGLIRAVAPQIDPDLFVWTDTCNVYIVRDRDSALLINFGDGSVLEHLTEIGIKSVEWVLFTDHHREQCQGAPLLQNSGVKLAAPEAERALFETPAEFRKMNVRLEDKYTIHGASYVRPPIQPIQLDRFFKTNESFHWRGREILCVETPGTSPGGMSYFLKCQDRWIAFNGDTVVDRSRLHTWFDTEWDYGFGSGIRALTNSLTSLANHRPLALFPSHGNMIENAPLQLRELQDKLNTFEKLYVRGYAVEEGSVEYQDKVSKPTEVSNVVQVLPHLFKFKRRNFWPNFNLILAPSGHAIAVDCGLLDEGFLDEALEGLQQSYGLKEIDAVVITHMHGDHFLEAAHLREKYGTQIWALQNMVDKMERPEWFAYSAPIQAYGKKNPDGSPMKGVSVDRALKPGELIQWECYNFQVDWMPGQTEFALCLHGLIDGKNVAFTGDNIFGDPDDPTQTGHEAMVAHNSAILEEGYIYGAEFLARLKPDILVGGHSFVMAHPAAFIERYRQWAYQMRDAFRSISSNSDYRYTFDPFWVRAQPYRITLEAGRSQDIRLFLRNFRDEKQTYRVEVHTPPGIIARPQVIEMSMAPEARERVRLDVKAADEATPGVRLIGLDVTVNGVRYGELFDAVVEVEAARRD